MEILGVVAGNRHHIKDYTSGYVAFDTSSVSCFMVVLTLRNK